MGTLEIVIILLIAFIFLGPERMVDTARVLGKWVGEIRRMTAELPSLMIDEEDLNIDISPSRNASAESTAQVMKQQAQVIHTDSAEDEEEVAEQQETGEQKATAERDVSGPVAHQRTTRKPIETEISTPELNEMFPDRILSIPHCFGS